ncbi:MAG: tRNA (N6-isopentenyl adenosine(37)-C2)-methylthiotransferase MiaB, partial [Eubacteriales bacterium]|nr:tRNA (N6-isopentenyl adenosine(37)-C2)-methylthiotransferase MiaB [Eubacteriales bacterium]
MTGLNILLHERFGREPRLFIRTYGCQQNVADSERIRGILHQCGCTDAADENSADIIVFNTCAVREHAEDRVFGNVGNLKGLKKQRPEMIVAVGGCMVQQKHIAETFRNSYPYVDIVFNTNRIAALPELMTDLILRDRR